MPTPAEVKFRQRKIEAYRLALALGHVPGLWEEDAQCSAVAACRLCDFLLAVDIGAGGGISGRATHEKCRGYSVNATPECRCLECA